MMDNASFLAWAAAWTAALVALSFAMPRLPGFSLWHEETVDGQLRRLQAKRTQRLARGSDRYFEELRTIDTRIADLQMLSLSPPWSGWRQVARKTFTLLGLYLIGIVIAKWTTPWLLGMQAPAWPHDMHAANWLLCGSIFLIRPHYPDTGWQKIQWALRALIVACSVVLLARLSLH